MRAYRQQISRWWRSGGSGGFAPAPPSSARWLSGPSESDNTLMTGHHLPQQQQGEAIYQPQTLPAPPPLHLQFLLPFYSDIGICFSEIMWFLQPHPLSPSLLTTHTHTTTHTFSPPVCLSLAFACCFLTSVDQFWWALHTRGQRGYIKQLSNHIWWETLQRLSLLSLLETITGWKGLSQIWGRGGLCVSQCCFGVFHRSCQFIKRTKNQNRWLFFYGVFMSKWEKKEVKPENPFRNSEALSSPALAPCPSTVPLAFWYIPIGIK